MIKSQSLKKAASLAALGLALSLCVSCANQEAQAMKTEPLPMDRQLSLIESNTHMSPQQKADAIAKIKAQSGPRSQPGSQSKDRLPANGLLYGRASGRSVPPGRTFLHWLESGTRRGFKPVGPRPLAGLSPSGSNPELGKD